jgi:hypothetical protein
MTPKISLSAWFDNRPETSKTQSNKTKPKRSKKSKKTWEQSITECVTDVDLKKTFETFSKRFILKQMKYYQKSVSCQKSNYQNQFQLGQFRAT